MANLPVEAGLPHDAERHSGHGGTNRSTCDGSRDLRNRHQPEILRQKDDSGRDHGADAGNDHVKPFSFARINQGAHRRGHQHSRDAADRHHRSDQPTLPAVRQEKDTEKRANACLHVGHEEVQREKGPDTLR
jgi:hypothetical protein